MNCNAIVPAFSLNPKETIARYAKAVIWAGAALYFALSNAACCQFQTVSTEGFTPNDCAHFCAHAPSKLVTIQAVWIGRSNFCAARKRILYSGL